LNEYSGDNVFGSLAIAFGPSRGLSFCEVGDVTESKTRKIDRHKSSNSGSNDLGVCLLSTLLTKTIQRALKRVHPSLSTLLRSPLQSAFFGSPFELLKDTLHSSNDLVWLFDL
jgi:hypothetical protein